MSRERDDKPTPKRHVYRLYTGDAAPTDWQRFRNSIAHGSDVKIYLSHHAAETEWAKVLGQSMIQLNQDAVLPPITGEVAPPVTGGEPPRPILDRVVITHPDADHLPRRKVPLLEVTLPVTVSFTHPRLLAWLESAAVFVPKSIREPFIGDLHEDMTDKLAAGSSNTRVTLMAISQVAILVVRWMWSARLFRAFRGGA